MLNPLFFRVKGSVRPASQSLLKKNLVPPFTHHSTLPRLPNHQLMGNSH